MIRSFADADTEKIFHRQYVKRFSPELQRRMLRSLGLVHAATTLEDLRTPPGNRLEALHGDRAGQHSIRINDQWRICLVWRDGNAYDVEIVDYHG
jgi:toxin HigB-1